MTPKLIYILLINCKHTKTPTSLMLVAVGTPEKSW